MPSNRIDFALFLAGLLAVLLALGGADSANAAPVETSAGTEHQWTFQFTSHERGTEAWFGGFPGVQWLRGAGSEAGPSALREDGREKPSVSLPVPAAIWMFGTGLAALGLARRRISAWRRRDQRRASTIPSPVPVRRRLSRHRLRTELRERIDCKAATSRHDGDEGRNGGRTGDRRGGSRDPDDAPACRQYDANLMAQRFAELAAALAEQPNVALGRRFGMSCVKLGKRPFLAHDDGERGGIAFRIGEHGALRLLVEMPQLEYWNPRQERQPKRSWLICRHGHGELLVRLALDAYEQALRDGIRAAADGMAPPAWQAEAA